jgi:D,D-heptose 1,7-bisphosphate phosphatase
MTKSSAPPPPQRASGQVAPAKPDFGSQTADGVWPLTHLAILAGGKGARLASVAPDLPKVLVPVGGKPVMAHQLELAAAAGIREVWVFAGHLGKKMLAFLRDTGMGAQFGLHVQLVEEDMPHGSAGMLLSYVEQLPWHFLVLNGDLMLAVDLQRMARRHFESRACLTVLAHPNDHPDDSDLIETDADDWVTAVHPYPHPPDAGFANLVNAGLYVASRHAICRYSSDRSLNRTSYRHEDFGKHVLPEAVRRARECTDTGGVLAYRSSEYIKDMGTPERLQKVEADWQAGRISLAAPPGGRPAVFLDRDGTLNIDKGVRSPADVELFPGVGGALRTLREAGYRLVVLTNQPVIARGEVDEAQLALIHRRLQWELGKEGAFLDAIYVCPHHPEGGHPGERGELKLECDCRKPATGLCERACTELGLDKRRSWMVGDQTRDIEMARRAGLRSVLVRTGVGGSDGKFTATPDFVADNLAAAAEIILRHGAAGDGMPRHAATSPCD